MTVSIKPVHFGATYQLNFPAKYFKDLETNPPDTPLTITTRRKREGQLNKALEQVASRSGAKPTFEVGYDTYVTNRQKRVPYIVTTSGLVFTPFQISKIKFDPGDPILSELHHYNLLSNKKPKDIATTAWSIKRLQPQARSRVLNTLVAASVQEVARLKALLEKLRVKRNTVKQTNIKHTLETYMRNPEEAPAYKPRKSPYKKTLSAVLGGHFDSLDKQIVSLEKEIDCAQLTLAELEIALNQEPLFKLTGKDRLGQVRVLIFTESGEELTSFGLRERKRLGLPHRPLVERIKNAQRLSRSVYESATEP